MKFRKKPVVIDAIHYDGSDESYAEACAFAPGVYLEPKGSRCFTIPTLGQRSHLCAPGDWIIRGIKGELYPCKDEIFRLTYEPA